MFMRTVRFFALLVAGLVTFVSQAAQPAQPSRAIAAGGQVFTTPYGATPPWRHDIVHLVKAHYPDSLIPEHPAVVGFYRVILDLATGHVRRVIVEQSSGYAEIDASIVSAVRQWRLKPNRWQEFSVSIGLAYKKPNRTSNHALQPTTDRRDNFQMTVLTFNSAAQLVIV